MNFHILFCSSRHVTIELDEDAIYETASYEIWVNGLLKGCFPQNDSDNRWAASRY